MLSLVSIFVLFIGLGNSKSTIKRLPGYPDDLPFTLETGYIGVREHENVQLFYYFIESENNPSEDPLLLYLTGGPAVSGLSSILYQIGPLSFNLENSWKKNITFDLNPNSWTKMANMIFLDAPAGTGFSYAKTWEALKSSDSILALDIYEFLKKWLLEHPKFQRNPLYVSGISYMGLLIPIVVSEIYNGNECGHEPIMNFKGYIMVSPFTDKVADYNSRIEYAHRLALISDDIYKSTVINCKGDYENTNQENQLCAQNLQRVDECTTGINLENILMPKCSLVNPEPYCPDATHVFLVEWANNKDVQNALGIREGTIETWEYSNIANRYDHGKNDTIMYSYDVLSSFEYQQQLTTKNCQVLIISGDHDMVVPYVGVEKWIEALNIPTEIPWKPWLLLKQIAGYQMTYVHKGYSLKYATIKGSGHVVALAKPKELLSMVSGWLASQTYSSISF
uniref:serine carboxypeptidase-like 13 n=1 Tax=Erigeron canadensis TaxID=72917 RepID=UPI001CB95837|nr:serine carboxypeptidase-like 13 [Erigeron canadensis]